MKVFTFFIILLFYIPLLGQQMDFESYNPPSTLVVPENPVASAKFPFIDIHSHHWRMGTMDLDNLINQMDSLNMQVVVNLSGRGGQQLVNIMENVNNSAHKHRIINFTNIELRSIDEPDWTTETVRKIRFDFKTGARGLKIYKSQGMTNEDSSGDRIKIDDPRISPVFEECGKLGIPVLIHSADPKSFWEPFDSTNERWLELKTHPRRKRDANNPAPWETIIQEQHNIFENHPNTTFVAAHMGWFPNNLNHLGKLLDKMPNMYVEIGAVIAELGRQPRQAKKFFEKYQDRVLFGKDSYKPKEYPTYFRVLETADEYFPYYKKYHAYWKMYGLDLSDEVLKKLYYKNAIKIIPGIDASMFPK